MGEVVIGVDVGTGSARAGVFDLNGRLLGSARQPIRIWHEPGDIVEQSSADIWSACATAIRGAVTEAGVAPSDVRGIGFDATCSLVVLDPAGRSLPVGPSGDPARDVIVWMDHRALAETRAINAGDHGVLAYVGGAISPEMQTPKLKWLKTHLPETFSEAGHFLDLSDFLTFKATGSLARSVCTVTCKWTYLAHESRWDDAFFRAVGLEDLTADDHRRIGREIVPPGTPLGAGLTAEAAAALGLKPGTPVAASLIDAHAGAVGSLGGGEGGGTEGRIAYIMGTSACVMASTPEARFVDGVWGPYFAALMPGLWLNEGGQSAAGAAIDHLIRLHPAYPKLAAAARDEGGDPVALLERRVLARGASPAETALLARAVHVLPDFLGNRSPFADPDARAVMAGLGLEADDDSLDRLYVAGLCGLGYGAAEVLEALRRSGVPADMLVVSGGASRSPLVRQILADATGVPVAVPATAEPVLLGSAMLGAVAGGLMPDLSAAGDRMCALASVVEPAGGRVADFHTAKRTVYDRMRALDRESRALMAGI
ncbi:FGGY-family carbohydrate kinase [Chthonobacter rhizosphaerae]|uniref:FGGY-family carbohydrate kinase n=1 Tax=Chthonobacter rhizosphaerae TaxID=2735553 RepID=UPI0015EFAD30|nr:FGGY-family carbohydrate kinase [Chthonobacter rhizosphaerae]